MSDMHALTSVIGDIVQEVIATDSGLDVKASFYVDYKNRAAGAVWIADDGAEAFDDVTRYVEVVIVTADDPTITTWDRTKNLATTGNADMAVYDPGHYVDTQGAADFLATK